MQENTSAVANSAARESTGVKIQHPANAWLSRKRISCRGQTPQNISRKRCASHCAV